MTATAASIDPLSNPNLATDEIKNRLEQGYVLQEALIMGTSSALRKGARNTLTLIFRSDTLGEHRLNIVGGANFGFNGNGPKATAGYIFDAAGGEENGARKDLLEEWLFAPVQHEEHFRRITQFQ